MRKLWILLASMILASVVNAGAKDGTLNQEVMRMGTEILEHKIKIKNLEKEVSDHEWKLREIERDNESLRNRIEDLQQEISTLRMRQSLGIK